MQVHLSPINFQNYSFSQEGLGNSSSDLKILRGFLQPLINLLVPHQGMTKPRWRCNHVPWYLVSLQCFPVGVY